MANGGLAQILVFFALFRENTLPYTELFWLDTFSGFEDFCHSASVNN